MAENKSEIKPFLFKKYIYVCECDEYRFSQWPFIFSEREIKREEKNIYINLLIIHYSSELYCALACGGVGEVFEQSKPNGN